MRVSAEKPNTLKYDVAFKENLLEKYSKQSIPKTQNSDVYIPRKQEFSSDGVFSLKEAGKNFLKGIVAPIKTIVEHPIVSIATIATTGLACSLVPVLTPVMAIGFAAISVAQFTKGCFVAGHEYNKGNYDNSEKAFEKIGQGTFGIATSLLGIKQNAKIVQEAKVMQRMQKTKLPFEIRNDISKKISVMNIKDAGKEILSLFATKDGRCAFKTQFKPFMIKARIEDIISILKGKAFKSIEVASMEKKIKEFKKTPEGKRRAKLSDAQIEIEAKRIFRDIFDELGIPEADRPKLVMIKQKSNLGGSYSAKSHTIKYNSIGYRNGLFDLEGTLRHEASHCYDAMKKSRLTQTNIQDIAQKSLIDKILYGEPERIAMGVDGYGSKTMVPPKMSVKMRDEFAQFAKDNLYVDSSSNSQLKNFQLQSQLVKENSGFASASKLKNAELSVKNLLFQIRHILDNNPDFVAQYQSYDDALGALVDYSVAHQYRYKRMLETCSKSIPLKQTEIKDTVNAVYNSITEIDGMARINEAYNINVTDDVFNQYAYSHEEVTAETKGLSYLIKTLTDKLEKQRANGTLTPDNEQYWTKLINRANLKIEERIKGLEYYEKYTKLLNNPDDIALQTDVARLKSEMAAIKSNFAQKEYKTLRYFETATMRLPSNVLSQFTSCREDSSN